MAKRQKVPKKIISDLFDYVDQYRKASEAVQGVENTFIPTTQIRGILIELAFKAYLAACGIYKEGHNLVELAKCCENHGLSINSEDWEHTIRPLQERYDCDDALNWKYPSRYTMEDRPLTPWITPGHGNIDDLVSRVLEQANIQRTNRPKEQ